MVILVPPLYRSSIAGDQRRKLMSRIPKERMEKALEQLKVISEEDYVKVKALAAIVKPIRSVFHKTPNDYEMTGWRDIYFPSDDDTPLEGWYLPAKGG
jgi:hypothetical protein